MPHNHLRCRALNTVCLFLFLSSGLSAVPVWHRLSSRSDDRLESLSHGPAVEPKAAAASTNDEPVHIPPDRYLSHIVLLAHDDLKGRETGSTGIDLAAGYIAGQFAAAGLLPGGPDGTYFQEFTFGRSQELLADTRLSVEGPKPIEATLREDFVPFGFSAMGEFDGETIFVGYGIANPKKHHDDYSGVDAAGKVVLMLRREPSSWREGGYTDHAWFKTKILLAEEKGAAAVLIVNQDPGEDEIDRLMQFGGRGGVYDIPAVHIKRAFAERLLEAGGLDSLTVLQQRLDEESTSVSAALTGVHVRGTVAYEAEEIAARNVIGVLPGMGPHANEYVVIGAHYDHLGVRRDDIYNGADDNASGTAGVIELARALARTAYRDRSVLCMTFAGEEIGLLGSKHYCADPTVPIDSIVAMLNMDMIGRLNPDDEANMLGIQGLGTGDSFKRIVAHHAEAVSIEYLAEESARGPSDHAPFYRAGVPAMFFFTGVHEDYHQPGDDTEKINADGAVQIVKLVYHITSDVMNGAGAPVFAKVDRPAQIFRGSRGRGGGVVMGIAPDMEDDPDKKGWRVAHVWPDGGADKAGMKDGDRIVQIDGHTINGFREYRLSTADKKPGDVVAVTVLRDDEELVLKVELMAR